MQIVWHGNYVKYFELGRCALLDKVSFGYREMAESGYAWPVVDIRAKYVRPLVFGQVAVIYSTLLEYENQLKIAYRINEAETGRLVTKGHSTQIALDMSTQETCFVSPRPLTERIEAVLRELTPS